AQDGLGTRSDGGQAERERGGEQGKSDTHAGELRCDVGSAAAKPDQIRKRTCNPGATARAGIV
ncbi:MAG: hypothetical protein E6833_10510, partial [Bradyrhizobium sp.]|nr:hypothetical protein [Bradyrhizobium sp.]